MELDIDLFRETFTKYASETAYPDSDLELWYETGKCYVADNDCTLDETCREKALMLMLAHLLYIQDLIISGQPTKAISSASEDSVSVSLVEPPTTSMFSYWLNTSPYGMQLAAMLSVAFVGGYVGGSPRMLLGGGW